MDITVGHYDNKPALNLVFTLLVECKRHKVRSIAELEAQLQEYADRYLDVGLGGLAKHLTVYGATSYGTKIRFFRFSRANGFLENIALSGIFGHSKEEFYWDLKKDGRQI